MAIKLECEIKLRFPDAATARTAVEEVGATRLTSRRLQHDRLLDTDDRRLAAQRCALRLRSDGAQTIVTFKGPAQVSAMKVREEIETGAGDPDVFLALLRRLGFNVWFRYEKYREEFQKNEVVIAVDETPVGSFVELEGTEREVEAVARALGYGPEAYITDSYRGLFARHCEEHGVPATDMLFPRG